MRLFFVVGTTLFCACAQVSSGGLETPAPFDFSSTDSTFVPYYDAFPGTQDFAQPPPDLTGADLAGSDLTVVVDMSQPDQAMSTCGIDSIKVNEVQTDGTGGATDEFIELYNPCSSTVSLASATIVYRSASGTTDTSVYKFTSQTIASKAYFVLANGEFSGDQSKVNATYTAGLAQAAGAVGLRDSKDTLIDSVGWGTASNALVEMSPVTAPASAKSAARQPDGHDTNDNATDFVDGTPTPGLTN